MNAESEPHVFYEMLSQLHIHRILFHFRAKKNKTNFNSLKLSWPNIVLSISYFKSFNVFMRLFVNCNQFLNRNRNCKKKQKNKWITKKNNWKLWSANKWKSILYILVKVFVVQYYFPDFFFSECILSIEFMFVDGNNVCRTIGLCTYEIEYNLCTFNVPMPSAHIIISYMHRYDIWNCKYTPVHRLDALVKNS